MTTITFDTLQFVKDLQAKGFKPEQAEGISDALKKSAYSCRSRDKKRLGKNGTQDSSRNEGYKMDVRRNNGRCRSHFNENIFLTKQTGGYPRFVLCSS
jgi:hypothetical protein